MTNRFDVTERGLLADTYPSVPPDASAHPRLPWPPGTGDGWRAKSDDQLLSVNDG